MKENELNENNDLAKQIKKMRLEELTGTYEVTISCRNCERWMNYQTPKGKTIEAFRLDVLCFNCGCKI